MNEVDQSDFDRQIAEISGYIDKRDFRAALTAVEQMPVAARTPLVISAQALSMAEVKATYKIAVNLCHEAIKKDPKNPEHYYRQGRILMLAGRKKDAVWMLRMGLRHGRHKEIIEALASMGIRRQPPLPFLPRSNPLNKYLGKLLAKLNLR